MTNAPLCTMVGPYAVKLLVIVIYIYIFFLHTPYNSDFWDFGVPLERRDESAKGVAIRSKKLLVAPGVTTRNKKNY